MGFRTVRNQIQKNSIKKKPAFLERTVPKSLYVVLVADWEQLIRAGFSSYAPGSSILHNVSTDTPSCQYCTSHGSSTILHVSTAHRMAVAPYSMSVPHTADTAKAHTARQYRVSHGNNALAEPMAVPYTADAPKTHALLRSIPHRDIAQ
eukprot:1283775-Rhodomonas_salina.1